MRLPILQQIAEKTRIPWVFLTSVLLGHPAGNTVYHRKNPDGEDEFVMFSLLAHTRPHGIITYECLVHNRARATTVYLGINYPEFFLNDLQNLLRKDRRAASPSLLTLLPQILLARSVLRELDVSERHAGDLLHSYEEDCSDERDYSAMTSRTHHFFWELYRSMSKVRRYTEYLKLLLAAHHPLSSMPLPSSASPLTSDSDYSSTQATAYLTRLLSETQVLTALFTNYISRTKILINQIFHYSAQKDRQLNVRMAEQSAQTASDTRQDSYAMRTISILTMLFLPGTFVSAVFGMNFFGQANEEGRTLRVEGNLWIYFAVTGPLTAMVFGCWFWWLRRGIKKTGTPGVSRVGNLNEEIGGGRSWR